MMKRDKEGLSGSIKASPVSPFGRSFLTYGDYFKGYSEYRIKRKNGKGYAVRRIYTGKYRVAALSGSRWLLMRLMYLLQLIAGAVLFIHSTIRSFESGAGIITLAAQALAAVAGWLTAWLLLALIEFIVAGKKLTVAEYTCRGRVCRRAGWAALAICADSVVMLLAGLLNKAALRAIITCLESAAAAALIYAIGKIETGIQYDEVPSDAVIPAGAEKLDPLATKNLADLDEYPADEEGER